MASADGSGGRGGDEDLVRGEAARSARGDRNERAIGADEPIVVGRAGQTARGTDELALGDGSQFVRGQGDDRERIEARVDREEEARQAGRAFRGG